MEKKRVAFYILGLNNIAGTERATLSVANELANEYNVFIFTNVERKDIKLEVSEKLTIVNLGISNVKKQYLKLFHEILINIGKYKIEYFISVESLSYLFTLPIITYYKKIKRRKIKCIVWEHFNYTVNLGLKARDYARKLAKSYADGIVVLTGKDKELWDRNLNGKGKVMNINNPSPFKITEIGYNEDSKIILAIGRYTFQKGFDKLIQIWEKYNVMYGHSEWQLFIIGEGEDKQLLEKQIRDTGLTNIFLIPPTSNIGEYYKKASFLVMTSRFEGLPMTLIEAQSYGLPIVGYDCLTGPAEVIADNENGFLIEFDNETQFCEALDKTVSNPDLRNKFSERAKESAKAFESGNTGIKWKQFLSSL